MPMLSEIPIEGPGDIGLIALSEFQAWSSIVLKMPVTHPNFRVTKVEWDPERKWSIVRTSGFDGNFLERSIIKAIQQMVAVRSRRRDHKTCELLPLPLHWRAMLKRHFSPMYDGAGSLEVSDGWFDLTAAMSDLVHSLEDADDRHKFSDIKSKYAELRADHHSPHSQICMLVEAFESISGHVCETCGSPGQVEGPGWLVSACSEHSRKNK